MLQSTPTGFSASLALVCAVFTVCGCHWLSPYRDRDSGGRALPADLRVDRQARDGPRDHGPDLGDAGVLDGQPCQGWGPFSAPTLLPGPVNELDSDEWGGSVTADGSGLFFSSWRAGGSGQSDIYLATRDAQTGDFGPTVNLATLNSPASDGPPWVTTDGLTIVFTSSRGGPWRIYRSSRSTRGAPFATPMALESPAAGLSPYLTDDGQVLYWSDGDDIWRARQDGVGSFGPPEAVAELNGPHHERVGSLSADGLEVVFTSDRPGGAGDWDVYHARRETPDGTFGSVRNIAQLNTARDELAGGLSPDGRTLYYNRETDMAQGSLDADIWISTRDCRD